MRCPLLPELLLCAVNVVGFEAQFHAARLLFLPAEALPNAL